PGSASQCASSPCSSGRMVATNPSRNVRRHAPLRSGSAMDPSVSSCGIVATLAGCVCRADIRPPHAGVSIPLRAEYLDAEATLERAAEAVFHLRAFVGHGRGAQEADFRLD